MQRSPEAGMDRQEPDRVGLGIRVGPRKVKYQPRASEVGCGERKSRVPGDKTLGLQGSEFGTDIT